MDVMRIKVRNCIRPDTYRYHLYQDNINGIWGDLKSRFGEPRQFGDLDLYEIDTPEFLIRGMLLEGTLTLIKKQRCHPTHVSLFHKIIGYKGE